MNTTNHHLALAALLCSLAAPLPAQDVTTISRGERVDIERNLVAGKFTVIEFYADW